MSVIGATNETLTFTATPSGNNSSFQVIIASYFGSFTSSIANFTLVTPPAIISLSPSNTGIIWMNYDPILGVAASPGNLPGYPLSYGWQLNGTNVVGAVSDSYEILGLAPDNEGTYTVGITNATGSTNVSLGTFLLALPGMVEAWGDDSYGECNRPATLTNVTGIAAGEYQSVAVTDSGTIVQWGQVTDENGYYSVTNLTRCSPPPASGVVSVAAGLGQCLALLTNGAVYAWGLTNDEYGYAAYGTEVPTNLNLTNVMAVACGWQFNVVLLHDGTVKSWGDGSFIYDPLTNVPSGLSNVTAIAAGPLHTLALQSNGTVVAWGYDDSGETNVPTGLTNVVAIAAGLEHSLALSNNGTVVAWGGNDYGQRNVPAGLSNVMAIAAGDFHSVALKNDGSLVEWGDNSSGQSSVPGELPNTMIVPSGGISPSYVTNTYPLIVVKQIAAGGDHTMASIFSPLVQCPVDVSKDLLLIYNTISIDSSNVCQHYLTHRPMVSNAKVFGINCTTNDIMLPNDFTNIFLAQMQMWLSNNPTIRPLYLVLFQDIPAELSDDTNGPNNSEKPGVHYLLHTWSALPWQPLVCSINMNNLADAGESTNFNSSDGTINCIAYIDKLASIGSNYLTSQLILSASAVGYGNTNWYFDDTPGGGFFNSAVAAVTNVNPNASVTYTNSTNETLAGHITLASNVAAFGSWGVHGYYGDTNAGYATNGTIQFSGQSGWYIIETRESFNGARGTTQGNYLDWFASNAFGGTNYSNTPVGGVSNVEEPTPSGLNNPSIYFEAWTSGRIFAYCAWNSLTIENQFYNQYLQVVGDPFTKQ